MIKASASLIQNKKINTCDVQGVKCNTLGSDL